MIRKWLTLLSMTSESISSLLSSSEIPFMSGGQIGIRSLHSFSTDDNSCARNSASRTMDSITLLRDASHLRDFEIMDKVVICRNDDNIPPFVFGQ